MPNSNRSVSPHILAIDTATPACSAAILSGSKIFSRFQLASRSHTTLILPMVDELLAESSLSLSRLDAIAFTHGPGSFTGIRIGFGVVQGLAVGSGLPVIPVSTLELLANTAIRKHSLPAGKTVFPAFDARMGELYWGCYQVGKGGAEAIHEDRLSAIGQSCEGFENTRSVAVGDGWCHLRERVTENRLFDDSLSPEAEDLLPLAKARLEQGEIRPIREVQPLYLRDRVSWKKRQWLRESNKPQQRL